MTSHAITTQPAPPTSSRARAVERIGDRIVASASRLGAWLEARARTRGWLLASYAVAAALVVCLASVVFTPIEPPTSWQNASATVSTNGRHSAREDSLSL